MITKPYTLADGRQITLAMPDMYQLVATDGVDIPNQALRDILDLFQYGGMIRSSTQDEKKRHEENMRFMRSQFELVKLCVADPPLVLKGDVPPGALTPRDFIPRDIDQIIAFFLNGGSAGVSATTDQEPGKDAPTDSTGATVG